MMMLMICLLYTGKCHVPSKQRGSCRHSQTNHRILTHLPVKRVAAIRMNALSTTLAGLRGKGARLAPEPLTDPRPRNTKIGVEVGEEVEGVVDQDQDLVPILDHPCRHPHLRYLHQLRLRYLHLHRHPWIPSLNLWAIQIQRIHQLILIVNQIQTNLLRREPLQLDQRGQARHQEFTHGLWYHSRT